MPTGAVTDMNMLPIIEFLDNCETDHERADWLLTVPDGVVLRDYEQIRSILLAAGFRHGAEFLGIRLAGLHATRAGDGDLPPAVRGTLEGGRSAMRAIACARPSKGDAQ